MKCKHAQQRLLATSGPRKPSAELQTHLEHCTRCRRIQSRLAEIDRDVSLLPVPNSAEAKADLIAQFLAPEPAQVHPRRRERSSSAPWQRVLVGLAACILVMLGVAVYRGGRPTEVGETHADPLLRRLLEHNLALSKEPSGEKAVATLAEVAFDLEAETRNLARSADPRELTTLADLFDDVVRKGVLARADDVADAEKQKVLLRIADRLFTTKNDAEALAREVPPTHAAPLQRIAATANEANQALRNKTKEPKVAHEVPPKAREGKS